MKLSKRMWFGVTVEIGAWLGLAVSILAKSWWGAGFSILVLAVAVKLMLTSHREFHEYYHKKH